ncbi:jasmonate-induced oxygenase 1 [Impatiens glandulifera]|uniref:jasmonate-induced oxygenase 1 n=1 Tax=Impatiens glandulifera TaxID=253017 RepID=UPI001FB0C96D|nr:jasmonate-induced oxygenase 1 [Impatiens glandulifera]
MTILPEFSSEPNTGDFRAPPPSPIASGRRSSVTNEETLTQYLENSLRVPDLTLPDRVFPRQKSTGDPPVIDFESFDDISLLDLSDTLIQIGCFQIVNHGISPELRRSVSVAAEGIFDIPSEGKETMLKSPEKAYGFEEFHGEVERETSTEEFVWCKDEILKMEMVGIWPVGYSNFSEQMEKLSSAVEKVGAKILQMLAGKLERNGKKIFEDDEHDEYEGGPMTLCHVSKHHNPDDGELVVMDCLKYDVIRMLIRGSDSGHALGIHICDGSSEFHVYSKKGWFSFFPKRDALIITVGDLLQTWSGGQYKHVMGRAIYNKTQDQEQSCHISMSFILYSRKPSNIVFNTDMKAILSLSQQAAFAIIFTLLCHFLAYIANKLS